MSTMKRPELLAPAGDWERLEAALRFGADAVYLGGRELGMRAAAANFSMDELARGAALAHSVGAKVYYTCNTTPTNAEADRLEEVLSQAAAAGVDAFIVADLGVMAAAQRAAPGVELHMSTQVGVTNYLAARRLHELGAGRVVLARELSLEDIAVIRAKTPPGLVLEAFVHGAMCMSVSGRCLLSHYLVGRDANRGECAQPCRWGYHLMEEKRPGLYFPICEDERGSYILNAMDLCMLEHLDKLAKAGVDSFKIEGRAKSAYYVAAITHAYRAAIELYMENPGHYAPPPTLLEEVRKVSHRHYNTGFYFGRPREGQYYQDGGYIRRWEVVAVVEGWEQGRLLCSQRNRFFAGDCLEALVPRESSREVKVTALYDEQGRAVSSAPHAQMRLSIPFPEALPAGTLLRRESASPRQ